MSFVAGALVAIPAGLTPFLAQPDTFALVMFLGALSLWLCARAVRGDRRAFVIGGAIVGLAYARATRLRAARVPFAFVALSDMRGARRIGLAATAGCVAAFVVVVAPWLFHQVAAFGTPLPSSGRLTWLSDYDQLFSFASPPTLRASLIRGRWHSSRAGLRAWFPPLGCLRSCPSVPCSCRSRSLAPGSCAAATHVRPFFIYGLALFAAMVLVFPILVPHGTFLHAPPSLVPHVFLLTVPVCRLPSRGSCAGARRGTSSARRACSRRPPWRSLPSWPWSRPRRYCHWSQVRTVQASMASALAGRSAGRPNHGRGSRRDTTI